MKFGIRECADVVFRAKAAQKIGKKQFYKDEPVIYFDTLKTSTLEGAATTVYATGGRGNARLMAWEGERTLTFTMEDALISPEGIAILTGAGIINAADETIYVHTTEEIKIGTDSGEANITIAQATGAVSGTVTLDKAPDEEQGVYLMLKDNNGNIITEPFSSKTTEGGAGRVTISSSTATIAASTGIPELIGKTASDYTVFADYYIAKNSGAYQIDITPDKFGGYFYIEGSTLFRDQATGVDMPAEFIIPNGKVQSNFTFTMAGSGDPSTFTFTVDAFPGRVKGGTKDVLAAIQVIEEGDTDNLGPRPKTDADEANPT